MIPTLALPKSGYKGRSSVTSSQPAYELPIDGECNTILTDCQYWNGISHHADSWRGVNSNGGGQQRREHQSLFDYFQFHNKVFMFFIICLSAGQTFDTNFLYSNNQTGQQPFT